jgi:hypothetical protein
VQRLHAPSEHFRDAGELLDVLDVEPDVALEELGRPAARDERETQLGEPACELL